MRRLVGDAASVDRPKLSRQDGDGAMQPSADAADKTALTRAASLGRQQVRTAALTVRVREVASAACAAVRAAESAGGFLESEETANDRATLTVRVPPERFTSMADELAALGTVTDRTVGTEDVTGDVADVEGRLKAARASADRVRGLLARAGTIEEITSLESELNDRESALESLETRRRRLAGRTAYAALTATFTMPTPAAPPAERSDPGFGDGLAAGWRTFVVTVNVLLVALGALLPFLAAAGAVGVPLYLLRRRRISARA